LLFLQQSGCRNGPKGRGWGKRRNSSLGIPSPPRGGSGTRGEEDTRDVIGGRNLIGGGGGEGKKKELDQDLPKEFVLQKGGGGRKENLGGGGRGDFFSSGRGEGPGPISGGEERKKKSQLGGRKRRGIPLSWGVVHYSRKKRALAGGGRERTPPSWARGNSTHPRRIKKNVAIGPKRGKEKRASHPISQPREIGCY